MLALAGLSVVACTGSKEVTREKLTGAVEASLASEKPCIGDQAWVFPAKVATGDDFKAETIRALDALARAGLVRSANATDTVSRYALGEGGSYQAAVPAKEYTLTAAGKAIYRSYEAPGYGTVGAFCYGRWQPEIVNFTQPDESSRERTVIVTYTRRMVDVPAWAQDPILVPHRTGQARGQGTSPEPARRMYLVQSDTGWTEVGL
ncbi:MAG TPA: hypothetical protein VEX86_12275 [Longimicrobium sp.]|nr:hypothetical protein [Longimicrobium sp.]